MNTTHESVRKARDLRSHPHQSRTRMDLEPLAELTMQIASAGGILGDRPIVITPDGTIVKGHRRATAFLLAHDVQLKQEYGLLGKDLRLSDIVSHIESYTATAEPAYVCPNCESAPAELISAYFMDCDNCGRTYVGDGYFYPDLEDPVVVPDDVPEGRVVSVTTRTVVDPERINHLLEDMIELYPDQNVPVYVVDYDTEEEEILALLSDNYGATEPDLAGLARTFQAAVDAGVAVSELSDRVGKSELYTRSVLALNQLPSDLVSLIVENEWPITAAGRIATLEGPRLEGACRYFINAYVRSAPTARAVKDSVDAVLTFSPDIQQFEMDQGPKERNEVRVMAYAWERAVEADAAAAWARVAKNKTYNFLEDIMALAGMEPGDVYRLVPELRCSNCTLADVLPDLPRLDWSPGYPCQTSSPASGCMWAVPEGDPFCVRIGWGYEGDYDYRGGRVVLDKADFLENARAIDAPSAADAPSAVDEQREQIQSFIDTHLLLSGASHPLATHCSRCVHRTTSSPVQSKEVPYCKWARRRRSIDFYTWTAIADGVDYAIPYCAQYAPELSWDVIIPAWDLAHLPRPWLIDQIERVTGYLVKTESRGHVLSQLTGRPMKSTEDFGDWWETQFEEAVGTLSTAQVQTLYFYALAPLNRRLDTASSFPLPVGMEFHKFVQEPYPFETAETAS